MLSPFPVDSPATFAGYTTIKESDGNLLPELHWDKTRVILEYHPTGISQKYSVALKDIRMQKPFSMQIWSPADRRLPPGTYTVTLFENVRQSAPAPSELPFPEPSEKASAPSLQFKTQLTCDNQGNMVLSNEAFREFHEKVAEVVVARVNAQPIASTQVVFEEVTLRTSVADGTNGESIDIDEPLTLRVRVVLPDAPVEKTEPKKPTDPVYLKSTIKSKTVAAPAGK